MSAGRVGRSVDQDEQIAQLAGMLDRIDRMPPPIQERLRNTPPPMLAAIEAWRARGGATERAPLEPRLAELLTRAWSIGRGERPLDLPRAGDRARHGVDEGTHRRHRWPHDEYEVWSNYGERHGALFRELRRARTPGSRDAAVEMGKRGYPVPGAGAEVRRVGAFASAVITSTSEPTLLAEVIGELRGGGGAGAGG